MKQQQHEINKDKAYERIVSAKMGSLLGPHGELDQLRIQLYKWIDEIDGELANRVTKAARDAEAEQS